MKRSTKTVVALLSVLVLVASCCTACAKNDVNENLVSKSVYKSGEEIVVTATGDDDDWVGVYRENDNVSDVDPICSYNVYADGFLSGQSYVLQRSAKFYASRQALKNFPALKYKVVLFGGAGTSNAVKTEYFSVSTDPLTEPIAPTSGVYDDSTVDGLADGTLTVNFDEDNFNATELLMYWANDDGILQDWTALAKVKVSGNPFKYRFATSTFIPYGATKLRIYAVNALGVSKDYCTVNLPDNCGYAAKGEVLARFNVVSDVHIATTNEHLGSGAETKTLHAAHLEAMAKDIVANSLDSSALVIVGDIANSGREAEWKKTAEILRSVEGLPSVYYSLGNHDLYNMGYDTQVGHFYKYAEVKSVYYEKQIAGYTHIFLGSEKSDSSTKGVDAYLSDTQLSWLDSRLSAASASDKNKPIFVYLHQSLYNTVAGSFKGQGWNGIMQDAALRDILAKYPQVYMFNGHSHWDMNSRGNLYAADGKLPNILNTASVAYLWDSADNPTGDYLRGSQGYYVTVYADKVVVRGRDFEQGKWIPSACYVLTNGK